ncbi:MAG: creatininase family protein [Chitinophagia bacterium]|nr:creatininase family protein [Chitinophagia bacterium]
MNKYPRPFILAETNWKEIQQHAFDIVVLPWGATEAHNYHLPYATDNYQADAIAYEAADKAWNKGTKVLVLPTIPFGVNTGQLDIPYCMNMNPSTQLAILKDVCDVVKRHGATKLVILNGHGANNFVAIIRELAGQFPELFVSVVNWYQSAPKDGIFVNKGDHADEMETSVMMYLHPNIVLPLEVAGDGANKKFNVKGFQEGWAWTQRPWTKVTKDTGVGDPSLSTPEKGKLFIEKCTDNICEFFCNIDKKNIESILK